MLQAQQAFHMPTHTLARKDSSQHAPLPAVQAQQAQQAFAMPTHTISRKNSPNMPTVDENSDGSGGATVCAQALYTTPDAPAQALEAHAQAPAEQAPAAPEQAPAAAAAAAASQTSGAAPASGATPAAPAAPAPSAAPRPPLPHAPSGDSLIPVVTAFHSLLTYCCF